MEYVNIHNVGGKKEQSGLLISCKYPIAPIGEKVFAVLGSDRIMYIPIDSELGKEYAVKVVKQNAWNVKTVKIGIYHRKRKSIRYGIPRSFARALNIKKGQKVLVIGRGDTLEVIPTNIALEKIGTFKEAFL